MTETQQDTLRAVLDRMIPPDDYPGAWEAGVGDYLARQWQGDLRETVPLYEAGLDALNSEALAQKNAPFASLDAATQDALLHALEGGAAQTAWTAIAPQPFITMLANHAAEGYYSDPGNGGNREARSWDMVGFKVTA